MWGPSCASRSYNPVLRDLLDDPTRLYVPLSRALHMGRSWPRLSVQFVSQLYYTLAYPILAPKAHPIRLPIWPGPPDVSPYVP